ncbi:MAG TPA: alpha/beta hydrolase-fold protein [Longimicrobiales bacterium]|nr:alpha/beta hydrolase-fold protein [Longimicrobiales bacterium]
MKSLRLAGALLITIASIASAQTPLSIGETFTIESKILHETRRINVYKPPVWDDTLNAARPVLYMPDGGIAEDFLHVAGLLQVSAGNGTMRPFLLVGIENTQRRRDMTGPTQSAEDKKIAPVVGGSAAFRAFIRDELIPYIDAHYRTTRERAIMGESLAGLFVVETFFKEPQLFDSYIAFDPSVWWNDHEWAKHGASRLNDVARKKTLYLANSSDASELGDLARSLTAAGFRVNYQPMPEEKHSTIYHPAALRALRILFKP